MGREWNYRGLRKETHEFVHGGCTMKEHACVVRELSLVNLGAVGAVFDTSTIEDIILWIYEADALHPLPDHLGFVSIRGVACI